ncbi:DUF7344 domain-containing protein [Halosimplex salinum]|uniref:DUF7344 domain-containing protein n=1 Tax=Halosimplex salinum TaxID=1710538 RepID=UPI000F475010|nr:hypothetical protein [Halosimplex salinum]
MEVPTASPSVLDALSVATRRVALAVLVDRGETVTVDVLASAIADRRATPSPDGDSDPDPVQSTLYHVHLPVLAETGAVRFDPETGLVGHATDSAFDGEWVHRLITEHPDPTYDPVLAALASERRQVVLHELLTGGPTSESELAVAVAAHERGSGREDVPEAVSEVVSLSLDHTHLPLLADVGLVTREAATRTVRPEPMPWRADPWVAASPIGEWAAAE